jgi:hypothetical protein
MGWIGSRGPDLGSKRPPEIEAELLGYPGPDRVCPSPARPRDFVRANASDSRCVTHSLGTTNGRSTLGLLARGKGLKSLDVSEHASMPRAGTPQFPRGDLERWRGLPMGPPMGA